MEYHSTRRFAWERDKTGSDPQRLGAGHPYTWILIVYNAAYWIPMILPWTSLMSYREGTIGLVILIGFRATANLYRNNYMTLERAEVFPLRIPWSTDVEQSPTTRFRLTGVPLRTRARSARSRQP